MPDGGGMWLEARGAWGKRRRRRDAVGGQRNAGGGGRLEERGGDEMQRGACSGRLEVASCLPHTDTTPAAFLPRARASFAVASRGMPVRE